MLITTTEAGRMLAGVDVRRESARRLLNAGFAGRGLRVGAAVLYDDAAVAALMEWPWLHPNELQPPCDLGMLVIRAGLGADVLDDRVDAFAQVTQPFIMSALTRALMRAGIARNGFYPAVITVSGFVAWVGEVTEVQLIQGRRTQVQMRHAGPWQHALRGHRLDVRNGGPWTIWTTLSRRSAAADMAYAAGA